MGNGVTAIAFVCGLICIVVSAWMHSAGLGLYAIGWVFVLVGIGVHSQVNTITAAKNTPQGGDGTTPPRPPRKEDIR